MKTIDNPKAQQSKRKIFSPANLFKGITLKGFLIFCSLQILIALGAFIILALLPVRREVRIISGYSDTKTVYSNAGLSQGMSDLVDQVRSSEHQEAFLRSTLLLSSKDSIALLIDLSDSLVELTFKGVSLFESKISLIEVNNGLRMLPLFLRDSLYSGPIQANEGMASIEKFPIVIKIAPKDTTEANMMSAAPKLPIQNDVFLFFAFDNNMVVEILQQEQDLIGDRSALRNFRRQRNQWLRAKSRQALKDSGQRGYIYRLSIELPREDARSIYRALPMKPFVVIRY